MLVYFGKECMKWRPRRWHCKSEATVWVQFTLGVRGWNMALQLETGAILFLCFSIGLMWFVAWWVGVHIKVNSPVSNTSQLVHCIGAGEYDTCQIIMKSVQFSSNGSDAAVYMGGRGWVGWLVGGWVGRRTMVLCKYQPDDEANLPLCAPFQLVKPCAPFQLANVCAPFQLANPCAPFHLENCECRQIWTLMMNHGPGDVDCWTLLDCTGKLIRINVIMSNYDGEDADTGKKTSSGQVGHWSFRGVVDM